MENAFFFLYILLDILSYLLSIHPNILLLEFAGLYPGTPCLTKQASLYLGTFNDYKEGIVSQSEYANSFLDYCNSVTIWQDTWGKL